MNLKYMPYVNATNKLSIPVMERGRVIATAVGQAIACSMALPAQEVDSASEYYMATVQSEVFSMISKFNEVVVFNSQFCADIARRFWLMRYDAYARCPRRERPTNDFFHAFFGTTDYFSEDDIKFLNEYKDAIFDVYSPVCDLIHEAVASRMASSETRAAL